MEEMKKVQNYLEKIINKKPIEIRKGTSDDSWELYFGNEFFGTVYKDTEDNEVNYNINISILGIDLK